jgi:serine-type D-Ala-D-Ala carboxypeptidase (penicillin-binding protein 5/6)
MKQRTILIIAFVLMIALFVVFSSVFSSLFSSGQVLTVIASTPVPTATDTPLPIPTPTPIPSPTPSPTPTPVPLVSGSSAYLLDATSGNVLLDDNSHLRVPMWSTTKIMTALLAIENLAPDQVVTVTQDELDEVPANMSVAQLQPNDKLTVQELLYGLLLPSGSDAAVVLAHAVSGDTADFVAAMNARAGQIGLTDTHYMNPYGAADPDHYSSAADLVKLSAKAMNYQLFAQIVATPSFTVTADFYHHKYPWTNVMGEFLQGYPGATGIKTGSNASSTDWCMAFSAYSKGHLLIGAEMQAGSYNQIALDAGNILNKGFSSF